MNVSVVVPFQSDCPHRLAAWDWVQARYVDEFPDWEIVIGECADGPYNRAAAILDGARKASGDVLVITDADVWCDPTSAIAVTPDVGWTKPHRLIHRLSEASTKLVLMGFDWHGLPLSVGQDRRPYEGNPTGTLLTIRRDVLFDVPPDVRFVGWGQEDEAWGVALTRLVGRPWQGAGDLVHLWHPPQPRETRRKGSPESVELAARYRACWTGEQTRTLIEEGKRLWTSPL